ncbi:MAG TPA: VPDSG-CTERM sorting domain-containing protein [Blastocatellia bacterium]|nr:VPDSG-CTERM sorting domain-containing protein [Blastocatellia bacterium]
MKQQYKGRLTHGAKTTVALVAAIMAAGAASAAEFDLTAPGNQQVNVLGDVGGTAIFADHFTQPAGTGVFEPFLTLDANGQTSTGNNRIESAYNTDGFTALYLDQLRPQWNERLTLGDLAQITLNNVNYYAFILDANEPGNNKSLISIDNIRIYTSATDNTAAVGNNIANLNSLGALRWAMNDPLSTGTTPPDVNGFNVDTWVKLDAAQENVGAGSNQANGGSGMSDMIVYVPVTAFAGALLTDYVWFYNLNGVHYNSDTGTGATSGYEEWRAVVDLNRVPEGGSTAIMLGLALLGFGGLRRKLQK